MGRGSRRSPSSDVPGVASARAHPVVLANEALAELIDLLTYISTDSPKNAASMRAAIEKRLDRLRHFPKTGRRDPDAPLVPRGAEARVATVKSVSIHYLFPLRSGGRDIVYVVTIRRGSRMPLEEPEYLVRWMEELARVASEDS